MKNACIPVYTIFSCHRPYSVTFSLPMISFYCMLELRKMPPTKWLGKHFYTLLNVVIFPFDIHKDLFSFTQPMEYPRICSIISMSIKVIYSWYVSHSKAHYFKWLLWSLWYIHCLIHISWGCQANYVHLPFTFRPFQLYIII